MQAIRTRYAGPTNSRGSRIHAQADAGRVSVPYDTSRSNDENHRRACDALRVKLGWTGPRYWPMVGGEVGRDMYWVSVGPTSPVSAA